MYCMCLCCHGAVALERAPDMISWLACCSQRPSRQLIGVPATITAWLRNLLIGKYTTTAAQLSDAQCSALFFGRVSAERVPNAELLRCR